MWTPRVYAEADLALLHELMRHHPFALLTTAEEGRVQATHLPFLVDPARGAQGTLMAHMARANPHWRQLAAGAEALVVFSGPHAYVSPAWYADRETVPTWNYAAVHAYGRAELVEDEPRLRAMLARLVVESEAAAGAGWRIEEAEKELRRDLPAIVGFEIPIARLEGKLKLNQNRSPADRRGVVAALSRSAESADRAVAAMMSAQLDGQPALAPRSGSQASPGARGAVGNSPLRR
jgi:transcriptional regulator